MLRVSLNDISQHAPEIVDEITISCRGRDYRILDFESIQIGPRIPKVYLERARINYLIVSNLAVATLSNCEINYLHVTKKLRIGTDLYRLLDTDHQNRR